MTTPKPEPLIFPRGVRFPTKNEVPKGNEEALESISKANITTGYIRNDDGGENFSAYFEANVHAPNIFSVFQDLARSLLPNTAAPLIGLKEEETIFGPYTDFDSAIAVFEPHRDLLQNDGFLEFGITFQYEGKIEEIFVESSKYFKIWTNQPDLVVNIFENVGIPKCETLEFIDEYPMVSESFDKKGNAAWPGVFESIMAAFEKLPASLPDQ